MTRMQKIRSIFVAIVTILASIYMIVEPYYGLITMALILSIALVAMGLKYLIYYFTMSHPEIHVVCRPPRKYHEKNSG